ncbi:MAG: DUF4959 domain-containing protein, partial [Bacteroidota bacterium]|nr:DUF4959 domain-containing protein [Bacteroidota bacterium]
MKKNIHLFILYLSIAFILCTSCSKDEVDSIPPASVTGVKVTADYGALVFKWKNPADKDLYYVDIAFVDPNGNPRSVKTSSYADSTTIQGFSDNKEITFNITAHDKDGNASTSYVVKAAPKLPAFKVMLDQITMTPDFGGAQIEWDNTTNKPFNVNIKYKGNDGS